MENNSDYSFSYKFFGAIMVIPLVLSACTDYKDGDNTTINSFEIPPPTLEGPIAGAPSLVSTFIDLGSVGFLQEEYFVSGIARSYINSRTLDSNGKWLVKEGDTSEYKTRIVVYRPINTEDFNGTVFVEWLNVSSGGDTSPDWLQAHVELIRQGYAYVAVSAQIDGVEITDFNRNKTIPAPVKKGNPSRYESLNHPGDSFSYDIFSQAIQVVRQNDGNGPLGNLSIAHVIAAGESQSASRMTTYVNAFGPTLDSIDGYFIHSRTSGSAHLSQQPQTVVATPSIVRVRDDIQVPVLMLQTESDLFLLGSLSDRQEDSANFRLWEVAGTAHADYYTTISGFTDLGTDPSIANLREVSSPVPGILDCSAPVNSGPQHFVVKAAIAALNNWIVEGTPPAEASRLEVNADLSSFVYDDIGNVLGGIRTLYVDVPIAVLSGEGQSGQVSFDDFCPLLGTTKLLDSDTLSGLYPNHESYVNAVNLSASQAVTDGFLLQADADLIVLAAEQSDIGKP